MIKLFLLLILSPPPQVRNAISTTDSLRSILKTTQADSIYLRTSHRLSNVYTARRLDSALYYADETINRASEIGNEDYLIKGYTAKIGYFNLVTNEPLKSVEILNEALGSFPKEDDPKRVLLLAHRYYAHALNREATGQFTEAQNGLLNAIELFEELNESRNVLISYNRLVILYGQQEQLDAATEVLDKAIEIARKDPDAIDMLASMIGNKGIVLNLQEKYSESIEANREAKTIVDRIDPDDYYLLGNLNNNIASAFMKLSEFDSAYHYDLLAYDYRKKIQHTESTVRSIGSLCRDCTNLKKWGLAKKYCKQIPGLLDSVRSLELKSSTLELLIGYYEANGQYTIAFETLKEQQALREQLINEKNIKEQTEQKKDFEFEKERLLTDREIALKNVEISRSQSRRDNLIIGITALIAFVIAILVLFRKNILNKKTIESKNDQLETGLAQKEILLKEIHHRVKNNLQMVINLLELQMNKVDNEGTMGVLGEGRDRIYSMALIHQHLYGDEVSFGKINLKKYLEQLIDQLRRAYMGDNPCEIRLEDTEVELDIDTAIPLGLIVNELVTNAFKYGAVPDKSLELTLELVTLKSGEYHLRIADNGPGFPEHFEIDKATSLGLRLVRRLSTQLRGRAESEVAKIGACLSVYFLDTIARKQYE